MGRLFFRHHNNCPRCPAIGAEDISGDEYYNRKWMRFSIRIAFEIAHEHMPVRVEPIALARWLEQTHIEAGATLLDVLVDGFEQTPVQRIYQD